jgi:endonuclease/exonuclease/phosphatase (EEP) superfamily protein YafD
MLDHACPYESGQRFSDPRAAGGSLRILSWNLLRQAGASVEDVAALVAANRPDLVLLQEATAEIDALPTKIGGYYFRQPLPMRIHGLAAWSPHPLPEPDILPLSHAKTKGACYPRVAQVLRFGGAEIVNVHLSHGQLMLRRQLKQIADVVNGHSAVIGDFNAIGNTELSGFIDVGPRQPTHFAKGVLPFRLDRCLVRGLICIGAKALRRGPSDHRPILIELAVIRGPRTERDLLLVR